MMYMYIYWIFPAVDIISDESFIDCCPLVSFAITPFSFMCAALAFYTYLTVLTVHEVQNHRPAQLQPVLIL